MFLLISFTVLLVRVAGWTLQALWWLITEVIVPAAQRLADAIAAAIERRRERTTYGGGRYR